MELGVEKCCIFHSRETPRARLYPRQHLVIKGAFPWKQIQGVEQMGLLIKLLLEFWAILQNILTQEESWALSCNKTVRSWPNPRCLVC